MGHLTLEWVIRTGDTGTLAHELGHTIGMGHALSTVEGVTTFCNLGATAQANGNDAIMHGTKFWGSASKWFNWCSKQDVQRWMDQGYSVKVTDGKGCLEDIRGPVMEALLIVLILAVWVVSVVVIEFT